MSWNFVDDDSPLDEDGFRLRKYPNSAAVSLYSFFKWGYDGGMSIYIGFAFFPQRVEIRFEFRRKKIGCATNDMD